MSLVKSPVVTPEKLVANQADGHQSHGPVTPEGLDRARAARLRHGYYSKAPGAELRVLLREEIKRFDQEHIRRREETEEEMTPAFRDSMLIPKHPQASLLVRLGDSDLRQLRFITDLLMKLQGRGRKAGRLKSESAKNSDSPTM